MSDHLLVATRKGLFTLARAAGGGWDVADAAFYGDNVSVVLPDPRDGRVYAALDHGHFGVKFHRKEPAGAWEECAAPTYPPMPDGLDDRDGMGTPVPWATQRIFALEAGGAEEPGALWAGTMPGGLFRSTDGGASWSLLRSLWDHPKRREWMGGGLGLPAIGAICVDPRDAARVHIGISCGGVWMTPDRGESWEIRGQGLRAEWVPPERIYDPNIQDVHMLAQCRAVPERMWVQHHNGIFHSADAGRSWTEAAGVQPSAFGFAAAAHPLDPDTAWFVPAIKDERRVPHDGALVVTRTRDGGRSFEVLRNGLPQRHAYDLVLRHGLAVDATGRRLAIGSSTGGLWISEDGGEGWRGIEARLPPIHQVRFVPAG